MHHQRIHGVEKKKDTYVRKGGKTKINKGFTMLKPKGDLQISPQPSYREHELFSVKQFVLLYAFHSKQKTG